MAFSEYVLPTYKSRSKNAVQIFGNSYEEKLNSLLNGENVVFNDDVVLRDELIPIMGPYEVWFRITYHVTLNLNLLTDWH